MITVSYQTYGNSGFQLRLRLYQAGETKYISVNRLLKGNIQRKHWNPKKQLFIPSCPFSDENNAILVQLRQKYQEMALNWTGTIFGMLLAAKEDIDNRPKALTLEEFINLIIEKFQKDKRPDGTMKGSYELYLKCARRLEEYCAAHKIDYQNIALSDITPSFVNDVLKWIETTKNGKGLVYVSVTLHSILMKADKAGHLSFDAFKRCNWAKKKRGSDFKYDTLSEEQCRLFAELDPFAVANHRWSALYKDFCLFILYTGQSVCDAVSLRYNDIQVINGVRHFVFKRRKISEKQVVPCSVPISAKIEEIMEKWRHLSKDGYIFPFRNKTKLRNQTTNNGDIKHLIGCLNVWLKKAAPLIGCNFSLHTYTFRHTAITRYISKNVPVIYVANMMGTSVDNCEKIYYNNHGDISSRNKAMAAMSL